MTNILLAFSIPMILAIVAFIWSLYNERKFSQEKKKKK